MILLNLRTVSFRVKVLSLLLILICVIMVPANNSSAHSSTTLSALGIRNTSLTTTSGGYQYLGKAHGQGDVLNSMVGPGASATNQLFYLTYIYYNGGMMDLVTVDPNNGNYKAYPSPASSEEGAWGLTVGPDKNIYVGTLPNAHLLQFNTHLQHLIDLGQVPVDPGTSSPQNYIWQMTVSPHDNKLYGCTYPSADLVTYNPLDANPRLINLGTTDITRHELYARTCVADPNPNSPYIYVGLGDVSSELVAYNIDTNSVTLLQNNPAASFEWVYSGSDGNVYSYVRNCSLCQYYLLSNGGYTPTSTYVQPALTNILNNGGLITAHTTTVTVAFPDKPTQTYPYTYTGRDLSIFRLGLGPDRKVYGGTVLPYDFLHFNPTDPTSGIHMNGQVGYGEPYSFQAYNNLLYIGGYSIPPLEVYNPAKPFNSSTNPLGNPSGNLPGDLRPQAITGAPNNHLYIGSVGSNGQLNGPLIVWNTQNNSDVQEFFPISNQGVVSLTTTIRNCQDSTGSYCIIGGTTIYGGEGTRPSTTSAQLFSWNPTTNTVVHQYSIPNVSAPSTITDLITNPANGYVYGIATKINASYTFVFDPATGHFINGGTLLPFSGELYNSVALFNGYMWGITSQGVFNINLNNVSQSTLISSSNTITAGFAMNGNTIYFGSNSGLWSYTIA